MTAVFPGGAVTSPYVVHAHLAPAPVALGARMANSLGSIDVTFDAATDRARDGSLNACAELLSDDSYPRVGPRCRVYMVQRYDVDAVHGEGPGGDAKDGRRARGIGSSCDPELFGVCSGRVTRLTGTCLWTRPSAPIRVDAHLVGPNVVGACDDAMFTASSSTGAGGRRTDVPVQGDVRKRRFKSLSSHPGDERE